MKKLTLTLALFGLVTTLPAQADSDFLDWVRGELVWNEEYDTYVVAPVLGADPFQEKLVWSDRHGDFIPHALARAEAQPAFRQERVWVEEYDSYVEYDVPVPCDSGRLTFAWPRAVVLKNG